MNFPVSIHSFFSLYFHSSCTTHLNRIILQPTHMLWAGMLQTNLLLKCSFAFWFWIVFRFYFRSESTHSTYHCVTWLIDFTLFRSLQTFTEIESLIKINTGLHMFKCWKWEHYYQWHFPKKIHIPNILSCGFKQILE